MPDSPPKRPIPSWQQATAKPIPKDDNAPPSDAEAEAEETPPPDSTTAQLNMIEAFLSDPSIQHQPVEKKKAFLRSKEVPVETIEQVLKPADQTQTPTPSETTNPAVFEATEFSTFRSQQSQPPPPAVQEKIPDRPPPVITYPEFLVDAHVPPPLLTPSRVLTAAYAASGLAALCYGASRFLLTPMSDSLTEARREFAVHNQEKLVEFNERLAKIVSTVPSPPALAGERERKAEGDGDEDGGSEAEDPTELYHRDTGTQTSLPPSPVPQSSDPFLPAAANLAVTNSPKKSRTEYQAGGLDLLSTHLTSLATSTTSHTSSLTSAKNEIDQLRHVLDSLQYGGDRGYSFFDAGVGEWSGRVGDQRVDGVGEKWAKVEGVKKEIRGVKGVLLSARRFPGVGGGR
ncbi:hypothetical protein LTR56_010425 [Elasticomyces elasticus]|nr:hypothetical protein LTR56_010425 [Elasticomyces elasticus]KAK3648483.1 hypothetical protein LTR22_013375 [Elasticomyces elasticus]KAK4916792.1 hypothetical protein LTR49_015236 [Elasticomyces elasticus]KAK5755942.1 hypothetical protein LTS12_013946 [Elasticomyces elasticus]